MSRYATKYFESLGRSNASCGLPRFTSAHLKRIGWPGFAICAYLTGYNAQKGTRYVQKGPQL